MQSAVALSPGDALSIIKIGEVTLMSGDSPFASGDVGRPLFLGEAGTFGTAAPDFELTLGTAFASVVVGNVKTTTVFCVDARQLMGIDTA